MEIAQFSHPSKKRKKWEKETLKKRFTNKIIVVCSILWNVLLVFTCLHAHEKANMEN